MLLETVFPPIPSEIVLPLAGYEVAQGACPSSRSCSSRRSAPCSVPTSCTRSDGTGAVRRSCGSDGSCASASRSSTGRTGGSSAGGTGSSWWPGWSPWPAASSRSRPGRPGCRSSGSPCSRRSGAWCGIVLLVGAGYQLGARWEQVSRLVSRYSTVVYGLFAVGLVAGAIWLGRRRRTGVADEVRGRGPAACDPAVPRPTYPAREVPATALEGGSRVDEAV